MSQLMAQPTTTNELMYDSIQIVNEALQLNDAREGATMSVATRNKLTDGGEFGVEVFNEDTLRTEAAYVVRFKPDAVKVLDRGVRRPDISLRVSRRHLEQVCDNPSSYRENPLCIDVVWLKSRLTAQGGAQ